MSSIFITADNHFWHFNIIKYTNRPFKSVEEMNETMISNWNKVVKEKDIVLHLGDFALCCDNQMLSDLINQLNGIIWLVPGNHDHPSRLSRFGIKIMSSIEKEEARFYIKNLICSHRPLYDYEIPFGFVNCHGHIHNKSSYGMHINISVDVCNFSPVSLEEIIKKAKEISNG